MKNEMSEIYEPAEDSYLLSQVLQEQLPELLDKNHGLKFLEIGCGSGINLQAAVSAGLEKEMILGTDINKKAVEHCRTLGFYCLVSDLFEKVKGNFDVIAFNPPYLPLDKNEPKNSRQETTGGKEGNEIIVRFLKQAKEHLSEDGRIFIVISSLAKEIDFEKLGYKARERGFTKLFFEKLTVWECLKV